ncbi:MAG: hypothetical protein ABIY55_22820 [Kofleriaceae bacterium]
MVAKECRCGFDLATHDPAGAAERASRELKRSRRFLLLGIAGAIVGVALFLIVQPKLSWLNQDAHDAQRGLWSPPSSVRSWVFGGVLTPAAASIVALVWGAWLQLSARRRLTTIERFKAPPTARVVR